MQRKHADASFYSFHFNLKYFLPTVASYINSIDCKPGSPMSDGRRYALAIQSGSWDLSVTPLRNVILNSNYINALLEAIKNLSNRTCSNNIHLVFIQTMPYPSCYKHEFCMNGIGYRTNAAISALSQYVENELLKINWKNLYIIDAMNIIKPNKQKSECINHFLCRHGGAQNFRVATTKAGIALASEILWAMCESNFTNS